MGDEFIKRSRRSFAESWLSDDRYTSWVRKVPSDNSVYYCSICNKNYSCSTPISRHADSANHKNNIENNLLSSNDNSKVCKSIFQQKWLNIEQFKCWLREVPYDTSLFFCSICNKSFTGGILQIQLHSESKTHTDKCKNSSSVDISKLNEDLQINEALLSVEEYIQKAEIRYAALIADKNIPLQNAQEILRFFQCIGNDSKVLKNMRIGRTKCTNIITNVLCPIETKRVINKIQNTKFTVFINETFDVCNNKWMAFQVRYIDPETLDVRSQLVELININTNDSSAEELFEVFRNKMCKLEIPFENIIALSYDNALVMTPKHLFFEEKLQEVCPKLMTFPCPCHSAILVAHNACDEIPAFCEEFIKRIFPYISNNTKHLSIFQEFCECFQQISHKTLKLCDTHWLSRYSCVERLLEYWDTIRNFLQENVTSEKILSAKNLLSIMDKVEIKAYFLFLKYVLNLFNAFNTFFQTLETRIHSLQSKSLDFLHEICQNFIKNKYLTHTVSLVNLDFSLEKNQKMLNKITLGSECEEYLNELTMQGYENIVMTVRQNCLKFYVTAAAEIRKRLPVTNAFLSKLQVFKPLQSLFKTNREISFGDVSFVVKIIGGIDSDALKKEWIALPLDFTIEEKRRLSLLSFDNMWKEILQCRHLNNIAKYPHLKNVLNIVRSLPNSNANPERTFSLLNPVTTKKRNCLSPTLVNAICVVKSALNGREETPLSMTIGEEHFALMSANNLYANSTKKDSSTLTAPLHADIGPVLTVKRTYARTRTQTH